MWQLRLGVSSRYRRSGRVRDFQKSRPVERLLAPADRPFTLGRPNPFHASSEARMMRALVLGAHERF
jgi:hypothetical protein